jgi:hypothetical protein
MFHLEEKNYLESQVYGILLDFPSGRKKLFGISIKWEHLYFLSSDCYFALRAQTAIEILYFLRSERKPYLLESDKALMLLF